MLPTLFIISTIVVSAYSQATPPASNETFPVDLAVNATVDGKTCFFSKLLVLRTWQQSIELCEKYNTKLAAVDTAANNEQLIKIWKQSGALRNTYWINANDLENKGTFVWQTTKAPTAWANWAPRHPITTGSDRRCLAIMMLGLVNPGLWINLGCDSLSGFICCNK